MPSNSRAESTAIWNFGRNITFSPRHHECPVDESDLIEILRRHRGHQVRAHGSLHSWSQAARCDDVSIDLSNFKRIQLDTDGPNPTATVGAGCQIKHLVSELNLHGWTTPTLGLIKEQTLAGATATATHGSGRHCLSHYIRQLRLASYDATGNPVVRVISEADELNAARCSLGAMGIVTEVTIPIRRQYSIEEHFRDYDAIERVLAAEEEYPIQQFFFIPWKWNYLAQHRRETQAKRSWHAPIYRMFWTLGMDRGLHWIIMALARWLPGRLCPFAFRFILPRLVPQNWRVVDRSDRQLTMQHQLYRHIETELFVKKSQLAEMLALTRWLIEWSAGREQPDRQEPSREQPSREQPSREQPSREQPSREQPSREPWLTAIQECGWTSELEELRGCYRHHYPICIRKVLPDKGLISMSGSDDDEAWYAVSLISYEKPHLRAGFLQFASMITRMSIRWFSARPHWGKHYPTSIEFRELYPGMEKFFEIRNAVDPTNAFLPAWMERCSS